MSLRIVWASPWGERSSIAAFGATILAELSARGHRVDVVRTETGPALRERPHPSSSDVQAWQHASVRTLVRASDALVLNLCDDYRACGAALDDLADFGALGIVHDASLRALAAGWVRTKPNRDDLTSMLGDADGWFASGLAGALVHHAESHEVIAAACPGPVVLRPAVAGAGAYVDALLQLMPVVISSRPAILTGLALGKIIASLGYEAESAEVATCGARVRALLGST